MSTRFHLVKCYSGLDYSNKGNTVQCNKFNLKCSGNPREPLFSKLKCSLLDAHSDSVSQNTDSFM